MSLWDPVLDGPSKHETFTQSLVREVGAVGSPSRRGIEIALRSLVRMGRVDAAKEESRSSLYAPAICLGVIATEQAKLGDVAGAISTTGTIEDPDVRAGIFVAIGDECRRASEPVAAKAAFTDATVAAKKIRGEGWRHWRARRFAEIGLARFRLGQHDGAKRCCRMALRVAVGQRNETRDQTLGDVVHAACLMEDTETAAAAIQHMSPGVHRERPSGKLAGSLIVADRVDYGLTLLENLTPAPRFECLVWTGRMLARPAHFERAEELRRHLAARDYFGILVGLGTALQDLGRYAEAAEKQRAAMGLLGEQVHDPETPKAQTNSQDVAKDLALNLARTGQYQSAFDIAGEIADPSERRRVQQSICLCAAQAGDLVNFRQFASRLTSPEDVARALAVGAAALVDSTTARGPETDLTRGMRQSRMIRESESLIHEAIQLARKASPGTDRDGLFWLIAGAATKAGVIDGAVAAAMMIRDAEAREQAMRVVNGMPEPSLNSGPHATCR